MLASPVKVFYSYAPEDEALRDELEKHLQPLHSQGLISSWHHRCTLPGTDWVHALNSHLNSASLILLLISSDFLASDYCTGIEMKRALEREKALEARVIPILLRPMDNWQNTPFGYLKVLPSNNLPITQWRNRDAAFADVAAGIRQAIENMTQFSISTYHKVPTSMWNVPYRRNPFFTGREESLHSLHDKLVTAKTSTPTQPQALCGLGGIGKTQIAIEYAYRYRDEYRAVIWIDAETHETIVGGFSALADMLQIPGREKWNQKRILSMINDRLNELTNWLLIFDNVSDLSLVRQFLPIEGKGHILLTTQAQALGDVAQGIEIMEMTPEMSLVHPGDSGLGVSLLVSPVPGRSCTRPILPRLCETESSRAYAEVVVRAPDGLRILAEWMGADPKPLAHHRHAPLAGERQIRPWHFLP